MAIKRRADSRFSESEPILTRDGKETFGIRKKFDFEDRKNLAEGEIKRRTATIEEAGKPWLFSKNIYGRVDLDWIIIAFNRIENPLSYERWPRVGELVEYPSPLAVFAEL